MSDAIPSRPPLSPEEGWRPPSRDFFGGPPPVDPADIPDGVAIIEITGEVPPDVVFTDGMPVTPPKHARAYAGSSQAGLATFAPLLDRIGPGAGAMVEREMARARAFEVIARAAVAYIEADGALDPYGSDYEALSEAVEENAWAVRP